MTWAEMVQGAAKAPKHEHEWISAPDTTQQHHRIAWRAERMMWWPQFKTIDGLWTWDSGSIIWAAAEIARLAGLTVPENDSRGEKG